LPNIHAPIKVQTDNYPQSLKSENHYKCVYQLSMNVFEVFLEKPIPISWTINYVTMG